MVTIIIINIDKYMYIQDNIGYIYIYKYICMKYCFTLILIYSLKIL